MQNRPFGIPRLLAGRALPCSGVSADRCNCSVYWRFWGGGNRASICGTSGAHSTITACAYIARFPTLHRWTSGTAWLRKSGPSATVAWSKPAPSEPSAARSCEASRDNLQHPQESWLVLELASPLLINFLGGFALNQNTESRSIYWHLRPHTLSILVCTVLTYSHSRIYSCPAIQQ